MSSTLLFRIDRIIGEPNRFPPFTRDPERDGLAFPFCNGAHARFQGKLLAEGGAATLGTLDLRTVDPELIRAVQKAFEGGDGTVRLEVSP